MTKNLEETILQELFKLSDKIDKMQEEMKNMATKEDLKNFVTKEEFDKKLDIRFKEQEENLNRELNFRFEQQTKDLAEMFDDVYKYNLKCIDEAEIRITQNVERRVVKEVDNRIKNLKVV